MTNAVPVPVNKEFSLQALCAPLSVEAPSGEDLQFSADFQQLQTLLAGEPEVEYGNTRIAARGPNWAEIHRLTQALAARTRDLRVAATLTRSGARMQGLDGAVLGLHLVRELLRHQWSTVHPQPDALDPTDSTARLNAILALAHPDAGLADMRAIQLGSQRHAVTVREIEAALSKVPLMPQEAPPQMADVLTRVAAACAQNPALANQMNAVFDAAQSLAHEVSARFDDARTAQLAPLVTLMSLVAQAAAQAQKALTATANESPVAVAENAIVADATRSSRHTPVQDSDNGQAVAATLVINSREDAIYTLGLVHEWVERHEPASPAPLLIRPAQRLLSMKFLDIHNHLGPDGVKHLELLNRDLPN